MGSDEYMRLVPAYLKDESVTPFTFQENMTVAFMMQLHTFDKLQPETVAVYLYGIQFMLKQCNVDCAFMVHSPVIRTTKQGMLVQWRQTHAKADRVTLPLPCEAIVHAMKFIHNDGLPSRLLRLQP
jgi:hypothetical protein